MDAYYRCPECQGALKWSLNNLASGAEGVIICINNAAASRDNLVWSEILLCTWTGVSRRRPNGDVELLEANGINRLRPYLKVSKSI